MLFVQSPDFLSGECMILCSVQRALLYGSHSQREKHSEMEQHSTELSVCQRNSQTSYVHHLSRTLYIGGLRFTVMVCLCMTKVSSVSRLHGKFTFVHKRERRRPLCISRVMVTSAIRA